jgi:hypothetical protein
MLYVAGASTRFEPTGPNEVREVHEPLGLRALDTRTWQTRWADPGASNFLPSPDGRWLYVRDEPLARRQDGPVAPGPVLLGWTGAALRVLDAATGREVATLLRDVLPMQVVPHGPDHLYVATPAPGYHSTQPYAEGEVLKELVAFEVGTSREVARRPGHLNLGIAAAPW